MLMRKQAHRRLEARLDWLDQAQPLETIEACGSEGVTRCLGINRDAEEKKFDEGRERLVGREPPQMDRHI